MPIALVTLPEQLDHSTDFPEQSRFWKPPFVGANQLDLLSFRPLVRLGLRLFASPDSELQQGVLLLRRSPPAEGPCSGLHHPFVVVEIGWSDRIPFDSRLESMFGASIRDDFDVASQMHQ